MSNATRSGRRYARSRPRSGEGERQMETQTPGLALGPPPTTDPTDSGTTTTRAPRQTAFRVQKKQKGSPHRGSAVPQLR